MAGYDRLPALSNEAQAAQDVATSQGDTGGQAANRSVWLLTADQQEGFNTRFLQYGAQELQNAEAAQAGWLAWLAHAVMLRKGQGAIGAGEGHQGAGPLCWRSPTPTSICIPEDIKRAAACLCFEISNQTTQGGWVDLILCGECRK